MSRSGFQIVGVKVINIIEENAQAIEAMVNKAIGEIHKQGLELLDIQTTADHIVLILGKRE